MGSAAKMAIANLKDSITRLEEKILAGDDDITHCRSLLNLYQQCLSSAPSQSQLVQLEQLLREAAGLTFSIVEHWYCCAPEGRVGNPDPSLLDKYAEALGMSLEQLQDLFSGSDAQ